MLLINSYCLRAQSWNSVGDGFNFPGRGYAMLVDTLENVLYVGGDFEMVGGNVAYRIAKWDGTTWSNLGEGISAYSGQYVLSLAMHNGELFAGGSFDSAGVVPVLNVAKWNGQAWSACGEGLNGHVYALAEYNGELYAGGDFDSSGTVAVKNIAKWNGTSWEPLGAGLKGISDMVLTLCTYKGKLYAGGNFTEAGTKTAFRIASWDGVEWDSVGAQGSGWVYSLYEFEGNLYSGRRVGNPQSEPIMHKYDGAFWQTLTAPMGSGPNYTIRDFISFQGKLYLTGWFSTPVNIAEFENDIYYELGAGLEVTGGWCLAVYKNELYVCGGFSSAGGVSNTRGIARWNPSVGIHQSNNHGYENTILKYPNPFRNSLTFDLTSLNPNDTYSLTIMSGIGQPVIAFADVTTKLLEISTEQLAKGIYFYHLRNKSGQIVNCGKLLRE